MDSVWQGMAAVLVVRIFGLVIARWRAGRKERSRRDTVVAILAATPPGTWVQELGSDGTTLTIFRPVEASQASIASVPPSPPALIDVEAIRARATTDA